MMPFWQHKENGFLWIFFIFYFYSYLVVIARKERKKNNRESTNISNGWTFKVSVITKKKKDTIVSIETHCITYNVQYHQLENILIWWYWILVDK